MSALDTLIRVKRQAKTDDLIRFLDEVADYEKLSRVEAFRDLKISEAAKKKLPLLAGAYGGDLYSLAMVDLAGNIIAHLEGRVPDILSVPMEDMKERDMRRLELMQKSIIPVSYYGLEEYQHDLMKDSLVGIFVSESERRNAILIIVKEYKEYRIYQGFYEDGGERENVGVEAIPYVLRDGDVSLSILSYSVQGNNAYPFGDITAPEGHFTVMLPSHDRIRVSGESGEVWERKLSMAEVNKLNMAKPDIGAFAGEILSLAKGVILSY